MKLRSFSVTTQLVQFKRMILFLFYFLFDTSQNGVLGKHIILYPYLILDPLFSFHFYFLRLHFGIRLIDR